jgi:4-amino-4-deoxy-L-arabinose transferase-like glycosyltransferase
LIGSDYLRKYKTEFLLAGILSLALFLNLWGIWNQGISNSFYAAAVKSALVNPPVALFNSFDPAGFVTIDKPPVGIWVQAAFAFVLGFSGWVLVLPQALAGVGSVLLVYLIVSRPFGKPAGLVAALALAVTPILVAVSRNGTMDSQLIFVLLLALWAVLKAARERSLPWLLVSVVLIGIGFNIKMIQAFVVVPAILAVYFLGATDLSLKKKGLHLGLAVLVLLAVSLSWAVAVDAIPADQRPYIGGSGDNTVLGLIVNYNGLERLGLEGRGMGGAFNGTRDPGAGAAGEYRSGSTRLTGAGERTGAGAASAGTTAQAAFTLDPARGGTAAGGMANGDGTPGITRFFGEGLAGQVSWLIPLALIGLLAWIRKPAALSIRSLEDAGLTSERGVLLAALLLWFVPGLFFFSFSTAFAHTYYIATITPPLAGLVGIGAAGMYQQYMAGGRKGWILVGGILATGLCQALFLSYAIHWDGLLIPVILVGTLACAGLLAYFLARDHPVPHNHKKILAVVALGLLFIAPLAWSSTPILYGDRDAVAGPPTTVSGAGYAQAGFALAGADRIPAMDGNANRGAGGFALTGARAATARNATAYTGQGSSTDTALINYLLTHTTNETWILATPSSQSASPIIVATGKPVMAIGGFSGSDRILTAQSFAALVSEGKVRYFLGGGTAMGGAGGGNSAVATWVEEHCRAIVLPAGNGTAGAGSLYDCAGATSGS